MTKLIKKWVVIRKLEDDNLNLNSGDVIDILLENRGLKSKKEKEEFFSPKVPEKITLKELGIKNEVIKKIKKRVISALKKKEKVFIYGDYDADGISGTGILWEGLNFLGLDVLPYIPERFSEGYGVNYESVKALKENYPNFKLLFTVDNGIVASSEISDIKKLGIDVIICDHHTKGKSPPKAYAIFYSDKLCGAALAWILSRELTKKPLGLELAAIGTIADQMPLIGINRSFAKFGISELRQTRRLGLLALFEEAGVNTANIGTYEINYLIAPRINAMGRLKNAIDSLRLLCTKDRNRAYNLAQELSATNTKRQRIVDDVLSHAKTLVNKEKKVIILSHESYHEGVIGLAAGKLVEEYYRPSIVIAKGIEISKASARSISGFNIIEAIRAQERLIENGGGHPMAAGFSIRTEMIDKFIQSFEKDNSKILTNKLLAPKLRIDLTMGFDLIKEDLVKKLEKFEPAGLGNPTPTFETDNVEVIESRLVGRDKSHLKLVLRNRSVILDAIGFGLGFGNNNLVKGNKVNIVYTIEENVWNGSRSIQLKIKDIENGEKI